MFVLSRNVSASFRVIATLVATAVVLWTLGVYNFADAANITTVSDTLSDSAPGASSDHTIVFTSPSGVANGATTTISFPAGFDLTSIVFGDIDMSTSTQMTIAGDCTASDQVAATVSGQDLRLNFCPGDGGSIPAGATTTILIGDNATGGSGNNQIVNPANPLGGNESFEIDLTAGTLDSGHTRVVILDTVLVTATVDTNFEFTVNGVGTGIAVNGTTTTGTSGSTTIPFGTLDAWVPSILAQNLTVESNAIHGFVVTIEEDGHLRSTTGADIDNFDDSVTSLTPAVWTPPANSISDENTWGHWGFTSEDFSTTRGVEFSLNTWAGVSTTPQVLFAHTGPADGATASIGSTTVGFIAQISPLQEAGDDYQAILTYIATPTF